MRQVQVRVEEKGETLRSLHVEVAPEVVQQAWEEALRDLRRRVRIPGFRPGKAPFQILEARYGREVEHDLVEYLVPEYYRKAVEQAGLDPVDTPRIGDIHLQKGAPLTFTAVVEVKPSLPEIRWKGLRLPRMEVSVSDEEIQQALEEYREAHAHLEACPEDHVAEAGHFVLVDYEALDPEGLPQEETRVQGALLELGSERLVPEFEAGLLGMKKGEEKVITVVYPADFHNPDLAGKTLSYRVLVHEIKRKVLPPLDDDLARDTGDFETLEALRSHLAQRLRDRKQEQRRNQLRTQILDQLLETHSVPVPKALVLRELERLLTRHFRREGAPDRDLTREEQDALIAQYQPQAERAVQERLLLEAIARSEGVDVTEAEVEAELKRLAEEMQQPVERVRQTFQSTEGALEGLRLHLREQKVLDLIQSHAVWEEEGTESS